MILRMYIHKASIFELVNILVRSATTVILVLTSQLQVVVEPEPLSEPLPLLLDPLSEPPSRLFSALFAEVRVVQPALVQLIYYCVGITFLSTQ